jgi:ABC-type lipopolysaccharide export system ATPase subunit
MVMVLSLSNMALSQKTPESAVRLYCALDGEGAGYSNHQEHSKEFDSVQMDSVEAAWDESTVIKDYEIVGVIKKEGSAKITVLYHVLGKISSDLALVHATSNEKVTFDVVRTGEEWKVDHSEIGPHITKTAMLKILNSERADAAQKAQTSNDAQVKEVLVNLERAIHKIETW